MEENKKIGGNILENENYIKLRMFNPLLMSFTYIDTLDYRILRKLEENIRVKNIKRMIKNGTKVSIVIISIKKSDYEKFKEILKEEQKNLMIMGYKEEDLNIFTYLPMK